MSTESNKPKEQKPKVEPLPKPKESPKYDTPATGKRNFDSFDSDKK